MCLFAAVESPGSFTLLLPRVAIDATRVATVESDMLTMTQLGVFITSFPVVVRDLESYYLPTRTLHLTVILHLPPSPDFYLIMYKKLRSLRSLHF